MRGRAVHEYLRQRATGHYHDSIEVPAEYADFCETLRDFRFPSGALTEVFMSWCITTGQVAEAKSYEDLGPNHDWLAGTADLIWVDGDVVHILDYKTGWGDAGYEYQLLAYAAMAAKIHGKDFAKTHLVYVREGDAFTSDKEYDTIDFDNFFRALGSVIQRTTEDPKPGRWCKYCDCSPSCPALYNLVSAVAQEPGQLAVVGDLTPERASAAWEKLKLIEEACKTIREAIFSLASTQPIPLASGMVLGPCSSKREAVDGGVAWSVIKDAYGVEAAEHAGEFKASKASITRMLKWLKQNNELESTPTEALRGLLEQINERGGIELKTSTTIREYKP